MTPARRWRLFGVGCLMILAGATLAHQIQTSGGVVVREVRFPADSGLMISGALYTPPTATAGRRAPAVLVSHGYINTREMQSPFAIELSRRGFVVLAMDMTGHGYSQGRVGSQYLGGPAALAYLRTLPVVDTLAIGLEGHSLGGAPLLAAAAEMPDGYRSIVLEGSTTGVFGDPRKGTPSFPRNLAVVFGQLDEFANVMWGVPKGSEVGQSERMRTLFGTTTPVLADRMYGAIDSGTARVLYLPPVIHPAEHFSRAAVGYAVDWFQRTLPGAAAPRDPQQQIWLWKEIGTLMAFAGFVVLLLGTFHLLLGSPFFTSLNVDARPARRARTGRWWLAFALTAVVPALTYLPLMRLGTRFRATEVFPQGVMNQLVVWAMVNAVLTLGLGMVLRGEKSTGRPQWGKSFLAALATVGTGYLSLLLVDGLAGVDYRFWVLGLKPLDWTHFRIAVAYLPFWVGFFLIAMRALQGLAVQGEGAGRHYATAALAMCLGFVLLLVVQYGSLFATGLLFKPHEPLNTVIAIQFVPLLAVVGVIGAFTYRRTNVFAPGAFICAMLITWYIAAGTAVHV